MGRLVDLHTAGNTRKLFQIICATGTKKPGPSAEEMNAFADRKRAQAQRLQDVHRKRQRQQLESNREKLNNLLDLEDVISHTKSGDQTVLSAPLKRSLSRLGLSTVGQLKEEISVCRSAIRRLEDLLSPTTQNTHVSSEPSTPSVASDSDVDSTDSSTEGSKRESIKTVVITNFQPEGSSPSVGSADSSKLEGRQKRAVDLLLTQVLPAAVQAQMIAAPTSTDSRLSEVKLKHRMKMVQDLEASKGEDFLFWLTQLRHKRHKVAKRRALRQSRIDLATEIGLHGPNTPDNGETRDTAGPSKPSVGGDTSRGFSASDSATAGSTPHGAADTTDSGGDKRAMTERRRMQLAKIRAMAAELKPTRGRGSRANTQQPANRGSRGGQTQGTPPASRGSLQPSGRGRGRGSRGKNALRTVFSSQSHAPNDDELNDADMSEETRDSRNMDELCDPPSSIPNPWDLDAEDSNSNTIHPEEKSPAVDANKTITPQKPDHSFDPGDESENERDQLVVLDSLLSLYDPEAFKDLGMMGMKASLSEYNQIHLGSEIIRACEVPFQPSFVGSPSAGVSECFEFVLRDVLNHDAEHNLALPPVWPLSVFITGGLASLPGMADRIYSDLRPLLPFGSDGDQVEIMIADNPRLDAWRGARRWAVACPSDAYITREIYEECGADYIVETPLSNRSWFNDGKRAC
ncbi:unnamed protein product [Calicophoron daubneyi]|uniref:Actin-related protein 5 n=1 Tax=Calicophoron daubneyi TaxID=300641 RepID=A0AAV2TM85_CALDB